MTAISVIIPVLDGAKYLAAAIDSVLAQSERPDEVIVAIDQGTTDASAAIAGSFGGPVVIVPAPPLSGTGASLNAGIAAARGGYLCFLDADDLWLPGKLARQSAAFAARPELDAVFGRVRQFLSDDLPPDLASRLVCPAEPMSGVSKQSMMIRRAAFDRVGGFDETLRHVDFIDWYARATEIGLVMHMLDDVVTLRRIHASNWGIRKRDGQRAENLVALKRALDRRRGRTA